MAAAALTPPPLPTIAGYAVTRVVARGGMADIYRARWLARPEAPWLALKLMRTTATSSQVRSRLFEREIRVAAQIRHPNVVRLIDSGRVEADRPFLVMEYVGGRDAESFLSSPLRLPPELVVALGAQASAGLAAAHTAVDGAGQRLNVVHRDVSPGNLRIDWEGRIKVLDFGVARLQSALEPETQTGVIRGKFSYMSPEQAEGSDLDSRSDVFSLGVVLWELLVGRRAFRSGSPVETLERVRTEKLLRPTALRPELPPVLDSVLAKCLAKDRSLRFQDAAALNQVLKALLRAWRVDPVESWRHYLNTTCPQVRRQETQQLQEEDARFQEALATGAFHPFRSVSTGPGSDLRGQSLLHVRPREAKRPAAFSERPVSPAAALKPPEDRTQSRELPVPWAVSWTVHALRRGSGRRLWAAMALMAVLAALAWFGWPPSRGPAPVELEPVPLPIRPLDDLVPEDGPPDLD